jgi:phosphonate transport system permease protein
VEWSDAQEVRRVIDRADQVHALHRTRPRSRFLRLSMAMLAVLMLAAWSSDELSFDDAFSARRSANAARFLGEIVPYPLQGQPFDAAVAVDWADARLEDASGAVEMTLAVSVAAATLAALAGLLLSVPAARNIASPDALVDATTRPSLALRAGWVSLVAAIRALMIFVRSVPEYIWAFLLVQLFGFAAWPAVFALAIHNAGILGKLTAETLEDADQEPARALRALGATRAQAVAAALAPQILPRFLLYFFYRWETCLREATVLGMLGVLSLGSLVRDARASNFYDEMVLYVAIAAMLVLAGDLLSAAARAIVRRAS